MADCLDAGRTKKTAAAAAGEEDRFQDLPCHVLEHLLSFLPSNDAVRTCVLAKRWRHIWKSVPSIRIDEYEFETWEDVSNFVNELIELRDPAAPLHVCDMPSFCDDIESWLQYAISRQVQVLTVETPYYLEHHRLSNNSVISEHLTRLKLHHIHFEPDDHTMDLSRCQALEVLDIVDCLINFGDISFAKSLRHLRINYSELYPVNIRARISALGLVTCELSDCNFCLTPLFGSLPSVITAFIRISSQTEEYCKAWNGYCEGICCKDGCSVLLEGLLGATNLELMCDSRSMIFSKDLKWRPVFGKLKTLLLNGWCLTDNFTGLIYFLQHSPILEKLTLQLSYLLEPFTEMIESYTPKEHFFVSKHLKVVEIKSFKVKRGQIHQIVELLGTVGVTRERINIDENFYQDDRFSYEQKKYK